MSEKMFTGTFYGTTREDEEKKLNRVKEIAEQKLVSIKQNATRLQDELKSLREVYDVEDKEGLAQWFNTDARFKEVRNDMVEGLTANASIESSKDIKVSLQYEGKYGQGYDGCGTHTHQ